MKALSQLFAVLVALSLSGCAWQRIPPAHDMPAVTPETNIPLNVGIVLGNTPPTMTFGPRIAQELELHKVFDAVIYPYRKDDSVDAVLNVTVDGTWSPNTGANFFKGALIGATFGLFGTFLGPSNDIELTAICTVTRSGQEIGRYSAALDETISWGLFGDTKEVVQKSQQLTVKSLSADLSKAMLTDRARLLAATQARE